MQLWLLLSYASTAQSKPKGKLPFLEHFLVDCLRHGKRRPVLVRLPSVLVIPNDWCSQNLRTMDSELAQFKNKKESFSEWLVWSWYLASKYNETSLFRDNWHKSIIITWCFFPVRGNSSNQVYPRIISKLQYYWITITVICEVISHHIRMDFP